MDTWLFHVCTVCLSCPFVHQPIIWYVSEEGLIALAPALPINTSHSPQHLLYFSLLSFLHTYLVWVAAIIKAGHHRLVPALHSAEDRFVQRPFGSLAGVFFGFFTLGAFFLFIISWPGARVWRRVETRATVSESPRICIAWCDVRTWLYLLVMLKSMGREEPLADISRIEYTLELLS